MGPKEEKTILREVRLDPEIIYRDEVVWELIIEGPE